MGCLLAPQRPARHVSQSRGRGLRAAFGTSNICKATFNLAIPVVLQSTVAHTCFNVINVKDDVASDPTNSHRCTQVVADSLTNTTIELYSVSTHLWQRTDQFRRTVRRSEPQRHCVRRRPDLRRSYRRRARVRRQLQIQHEPLLDHFASSAVGMRRRPPDFQRKVQ